MTEAEPPGLLCVHAHPDDEAILTGGILARAADEGFRTAVVTCTGGELGEVFDEGYEPYSVGARLAEIRLAELTEALEVLGAGVPRLLGYRDSGMAGDGGNANPASFWQSELDEAAGRLVTHLRAFRPDVVVTYDSFGVYGHPDHIQAHRVTLVALEAAASAGLYLDAGEPWTVRKVYLVTIPRSAVVMANEELARRGLPSPFGTVTEPGELAVGSDDHLIGTTVDVRPWLDQKLTALRAHRSQLGPDSYFLNVPEDLAEPMFGTEWFIRYRCLVDVPERETDLFTGVRE